MAISELPSGSLKEIPTFAWLIKAGNNAYIYTGMKMGLNYAVGRVENANPGSTVHVSQIVK
jgi:hypothetical protein